MSGRWYQCYTEEPAASIFRVLLPCKWRQYVPPKHWYLSSTLYVLPILEDCNFNIQYHENLTSHDLVCFCYTKGTQKSVSELTTVQWTRCYLARMGNMVCRLHESAGCITRTLTETKHTVKTTNLSFTSYIDVFLGNKADRVMTDLNHRHCITSQGRPGSSARGGWENYCMKGEYMRTAYMFLSNL
jgi:hypothetical protein